MFKDTEFKRVMGMGFSILIALFTLLAFAQDGNPLALIVGFFTITIVRLMYFFTSDEKSL
jgi:hypothetical protein